MCSTANIMGGPNIFTYALLKSAIRGMTKSITCLSAQNGYSFRDNSFYPYNMSTSMLNGLLDMVHEVDTKAAAQIDDI